VPIGDDKLRELPQTVNELVADRAIRHALYLERYKTHLVEDMLKDFNGKMEPALMQQIEQGLKRATEKSAALKAIFRDNGDLVREEYKLMEAKLYDQLQDFSNVESAWLIKTLETHTPIAWNFVAPSPSILNQLVTKKPMEGALVEEWFSKLANDTAFAVNRQIQIGIIEGEGIEKIVRRIKGTPEANYTNTDLTASRSHLRSVVRTSVSHVSHGAREETYKANTDVIKGVQIVATLDTRTCTQCMELDGKVYAVDEGRRPQFHWSCRCSDTPVTKSWKELGINASEASPGTRASMNGQVPDTTTYPAWLKKQSAAVQDEALGKARGKLFRSGELKIKEFTDTNGRPITLARLKAKLE